MNQSEVQGEEKREAVRAAARRIYHANHDENDIDVLDHLTCEAVDLGDGEGPTGYWVGALLWVPANAVKEGAQ